MNSFNLRREISDRFRWHCPSTLILFLFLVLMVTAVSVPATAQDSAPGGGIDRVHFNPPTGVPMQAGPDESGKFKEPRKAPRNPSQLMEPNAEYPPPGIKRALKIFLLLVLMAFYWIFLRKSLPAVIPVFGKIGKKLISLVPRHELSDTPSGGHERNEDIIRDMAVEAERMIENKKTAFRNFSLSRALPPPVSTSIPGLSEIEKGIHLFLADSPDVSRALSVNLTAVMAGIDRSILFFSPRISPDEMAQAIISLEEEKPWSLLDEQSRYRIDRKVEEFMARYRDLHFGSPLGLEPDTLALSIKKTNRDGRLVAIIIDDFTLLSGAGAVETMDTLTLTAKKNGIPVIIIDNSSRMKAWREKSDKFNVFLNFEKNGDTIMVRNILTDESEPVSLKIEKYSGKLTAVR